MGKKRVNILLTVLEAVKDVSLEAKSQLRKNFVLQRGC